MMSDKPIIFNAEMVRALLDGRKTQTRRPVKPHMPDYKDGSKAAPDGLAMLPDGTTITSCPHGKPGDLLWVRETWMPTVVATNADIGEKAPTVPAVNFKAGGGQFHLGSPEKKQLSKCTGKWKPSIHMPRWASRLTLKITNVRVERVRDITWQDAQKEGYVGDMPMIDGKSWFSYLWDSIYNNWDDNPWVWVIEFEAIKENIDSVLEKEVMG